MRKPTKSLRLRPPLLPNVTITFLNVKLSLELDDLSFSHRGFRNNNTQILRRSFHVFSAQALSEHESNEEADGIIVSFDGGSIYYRTEDVEELCSSI